MSLCFIVKKDYFLSVYVDDIKLAGKKHNFDSDVEKYSIKKFDLGEPTSFLDHDILGLHSTSTRSKPKILWTITRTMFESRISAGGLEKLPFSQNNRIFFMVV